MGGNQISDWIETDHLWARVSNIHGREYFAAAAVQLEKMLVLPLDIEKVWMNRCGYDSRDTIMISSSLITLNTKTGIWKSRLC